MHVPLLLNWYLNPYHTPIVVAQKMGFYQEQDIDLALLEPHNPTDVTKIVGRGEVKLGLKAMIHCFAARDRGYPIQSIGTLFDEPPTGFISLKRNNIQTLEDIKGKCIGYIGEFGKIMIDQLAKESGIQTSEYTTKRIGMDAAKAIVDGKVDMAIGLSCFQQLEVESYGEESNFLRIDQLADLGCCCFCSILFIAHESLLQTEQTMLKRFMQATLQGMQYTRENPQQAFELLISAKPNLNTPLFKNIFYHCLPFFSRDLLNVDRDWQKVSCYAKRLNILSEQTDYKTCFTNQFIPAPVPCEAA